MAKDGDQWFLVCLQCEGVTVEVMVKCLCGPTHCKGLKFNGYIIFVTHAGPWMQSTLAGHSVEELHLDLFYMHLSGA